MASADEIRGAFVRICAVYPAVRGENAASMKALLGIWIEVLSDVPGQTLGAAVALMLSEDREFRPSPGAIRSRAFDLAPAGHPSPEEAWQIASRYVDVLDARAPGSSDPRPPPIADPLVRGVYERFGWYEWSEGNQDGLRRDFMRAYREALDREERERRMPAPVRALLEANRAAATAELSSPASIAALDGTQEARGSRGLRRIG